jgi:hypothetical protein
MTTRAIRWLCAEVKATFREDPRFQRAIER